MHSQNEYSETYLSNNPAIFSEILKLNIKRIRLISILCLITLTAMFIVNFYSHFISKTDSTNFAIYVLPYSFAFLLNIVAFFYTNKTFNSKHPFKKNDKTRVILQYTYFSATLLVSAVISFMDQIYYDHLVIFILNIVLCCCAIILPLYLVLPPVVLSSCITLSAMFFDSDSVFEIKMSLMLVVVLTVILLVLNNLNYKIIFKTLYSQTLLLKEKMHTQQLTEELQSAAFTDELTNLANRRGYLNHLSSLDCKIPKRVTVLIIDIDSFKNYNDYYGHAYGDIVLAKVAATLHQVCQSRNRFVARWGGEEFLILLEDHTNEEILAFYKDFLHNVEEFNIEHANSEVSSKLTFSVGGNSTLLKNIDEINDCILKADEAQYIVKRSKKDDFVLLEEGQTIYKSKKTLNYC